MLSVACPARGSESTAEEVLAALRAGRISANQARAMMGLDSLTYLEKQGPEITGVFRSVPPYPALPYEEVDISACREIYSWERPSS